MAKATLSFSLPDEQTEFETAFHGADYKTILWSIDTYLRSRIKYEDLDEATKAALLDVRRELHEAIEERGVSID